MRSRLNERRSDLDIDRGHLQPCTGVQIAVFALWSPVMAGQVKVTKGEDALRHETMGSRSSDYETKSRVERRLRLEDDIQWNTLSVQVNDGHVVLHGIVST